MYASSLRRNGLESQTEKHLDTKGDNDFKLTKSLSIVSYVSLPLF